MIMSRAFASVLLVFCITSNVQAADDPLPSWNDGAVKQAIVDFVKATTDKSSPDFVPPEERIATFDQDGTLWSSIRCIAKSSTRSIECPRSSKPSRNWLMSSHSRR